MIRTLFACVAFAGASLNLFAQETAEAKRRAPILTVTLQTEKRDYKVGEPWVGEFKVTATAAADKPLTIRAWTRFFAQYAVGTEFHGPLEEATLSDALATGGFGENYREEGNVAPWNSPDRDIFARTSRTVVPAGESATVTFTHYFGSALKAKRFQYRMWWAVVVEPEPGHFMLLFSQDATSVEFITEGDEIDFDSWLKQHKVWEDKEAHKLHNRLSIYGDVIKSAD